MERTFSFQFRLSERDPLTDKRRNLPSFGEIGLLEHSGAPLLEKVLNGSRKAWMRG